MNENGIETFPDEIEEKILAYKNAWESVLKYKKNCESEAESESGHIKVKGLSLEIPTTEVIAILESNPKARKRTMLDLINPKLAEFLVNSPLAKHIPQEIHLIAYPEDLGPDLFPGDNDYGGIHRFRGGYPAAFLPLRFDEGSEEYRLMPFVVGHEAGEIIYTNLHLQNSDRVPPPLHDDHELKEGFCNVIGILFQKSVFENDGSTYDEIFQELYEDCDLKKILGDTSKDFLSKEERRLADYEIAGSIVDRLRLKYGMEKVVEYFDNEVKRDVDKFVERARGRLEMTYAAFGFGAERVKHPTLDELLAKLGYGEGQFSSVHSIVTEAPDDRSEGAIAATMIDQFAQFEERKKGYADGPKDSGGKIGGPSPSFINSVINCMNEECAKKAFGDDFSPHDFIMTWKKEMLEQYAE